MNWISLLLTLNKVINWIPEFHVYQLISFYLFVSTVRRLGDQKPCLQCITNHEPEPEYKPTVKIGSYRVPDFMEAFVEKMIGSYLDNPNSVMVIDLSFFIRTNSDLANLCSPYGTVTRADLAVELESGYAFPGCFGFVSFATRDDAQNAINNLKGVQWLSPTTTS